MWFFLKKLMFPAMNGPEVVHSPEPKTVVTEWRLGCAAFKWHKFATGNMMPGLGKAGFLSGEILNLIPDRVLDPKSAILWAKESESLESRFQNPKSSGVVAESSFRFRFLCFSFFLVPPLYHSSAVLLSTGNTGFIFPSVGNTDLWKLESKQNQNGIAIPTNRNRNQFHRVSFGLGVKPFIRARN